MDSGYSRFFQFIFLGLGIMIVLASAGVFCWLFSASSLITLATDHWLPLSVVIGGLLVSGGIALYIRLT